MLLPLRYLLCLAALLSLCACGGRSAIVYAPVTERAYQSADTHSYYTVKPGDSVYSIAWAYGLDYRDLATANKLSKPYYLAPGTRLQVRAVRTTHLKALHVAQLSAPGTKAAKALSEGLREEGQLFPERVEAKERREAVSQPLVVKAPQKWDRQDSKKSQPGIKKPVGALTEQPKPVIPAQEEQVGGLANARPSAAGWVWPSKGKVVGRFVEASVSGNKGIDIQGSLGQPVLAAAGGKVVYSGSGVRGYGNLIIIKHNQNYLSAYAYNQKLLVKEGEAVKAGQPIAEMGKAETGRVLLHFEIRYNGRPVDPMTYLR